MNPMLDAEAVQQLIRQGFPRQSAQEWFWVEALEAGRVQVRLAFRPWMLRPGQVVSGPALFAAVDTAMYACVLAHLGPQLMAVTSDLTLHFLNKAVPGDLHAEARLLKQGRRLVVMDCRAWTEDPARLALHATGSYVLPASG
ncbi:MAG TPA: PaaI family thioesterase [Nevskiaceae bacterium]|nr:PaaI family thioesterase [Nevskiaceae bacterium]